MHLGIVEGLCSRCKGVLRDVQGVFYVSNGSSLAGKWTSVSSCLLPPAADSPVPGIPRPSGRVQAHGVVTRPRGDDPAPAPRCSGAN